LDPRPGTATTRPAGRGEDRGRRVAGRFRPGAAANPGPGGPGNNPVFPANAAAFPGIIGRTDPAAVRRANHDDDPEGAGMFKRLVFAALLGALCLGGAASAQTKKDKDQPDPATKKK